MRGLLLAAAVTCFLFGGFAPHAFAQSSSLNGQVEGAVTDQTGSAVVDASVVATNIETGAVRSTNTDRSGLFRFPLLPLGTYRLAGQAAGFRPLIRDGITLLAGQAVNVELQLETGQISEAVTVQGDALIAYTGKTDLGRVMNTREVHNIPLPTRNPYSFVILQAGVTGRAMRGGAYPQVNINGLLRRTNYLLDGNNNTRGSIAGERIMLVSETYIAEMQLLTPGFAAEFGNTTGMVVNMVTPSGTNEIHGSGMYLFSRQPFYTRPFFFAGTQLPDSRLNNVAVAIGGPVIKNRWLFYFGHERLYREDNSNGDRRVRIREEDKQRLIAAGLPASIFVPSIPISEFAAHYIFRTDVQLNGNNRLAARFNHAATYLKPVTGGGLNTLQRTLDVYANDHSVGLQLVSVSRQTLNELRFQFVRGKVAYVRSRNSGTGPTINIPNVANFGSPDGERSSISNVKQIQDNLTWTRGRHAIKFGAGFSLLESNDRAAVFSVYTFPSIPAYIAAHGLDPRSYTRYEQTFGDPETRQRSTYWNSFVQDDWKVTRRLTLNYGLRYDLYVVPDADPTSPFPASREFRIDKNNFAPRLGVAYVLREGTRPLVLRAGAGIYYEPPWTSMYTRALRENGDPDFFSIRILGSNGGTRMPDPLAPVFPNTCSVSLPPCAQLPRQNIVTVAPDFESMYAIHSNVQLEQALTSDLSAAIGFVHSGGRHIPVYRSINPINPVRFLADGRPVFGPDRLDPRFNVIQMAESAGVSRYDALTLQLTQRFSRGVQFAANYTLSKATDDAPEQNVSYNDPNGLLRALSDPTNRSLDKGYSFGDQRHTFVMSLVARPHLDLQNRTLRYLGNHNQFGIITKANSGERFTPRVAGDIDLNADGLYWPDRPVGIMRNSGKTPPQFDLDLRYSRFFDLGERFHLEAFGEFQNLFNINSIVQYNNVAVETDPLTGMLVGSLPDFRALNQSRNQAVAQESRQVQIGIKFIF